MLLACASAFSARAQSAAPAPSSKTQASPQEESQKKGPDYEAELQKAISDAGNDRAAIVRNLLDYLKRFPDAPRKADIYRALVDSYQKLNDSASAADFAERYVALHPDDSEMMLQAVELLEKLGDDHSLVKAVGYLTRVIDRVEKLTPADKPARLSQEEWQSKHTKSLASLYLYRGQLEFEQHSYDVAKKDLDASYILQPAAITAQRLGEIAELQKDLPAAIANYLNAFVLPENGAGGAVDRHEIRKKLGNVWRLAHGNDAGLGDAILAAYDKTASPPQASSVHNKDAKEPFAFILRRLDGSPAPLAPLKGKILVLNFWATWCGPCRALEPQFARVMSDFAPRSEVAFFALNIDEDETRVQPYVQREKMTVPVLFADGFDDFLGVRSLPTVLVLDRAGKIVYRVDGFNADEFIASLTAAIKQALTPAT
ncbi:MAG TPA: redoxin family protein [Candidatus Acidoferrales bacterium]|jgi:thiol-disulfide isomerase/thioredoxin|nr:redoxin family protein [Candidatus Acidoferrales bacterium]